jgi:predicted dehydrogenase
MSRLPGVEFKYVCDIWKDRGDGIMKDLTRVQKRAPQRISDMRVALDDREVDAVVIATPEHWHALATVMACQAGKDVYVEKNPCNAIWEGRKMIEAARKYGRIVQVGFQNRSGPYAASARDYIASGKLGRIVHVKVYNMLDGSRWEPVPDGPAPAGLDWDTWLGPAPAVAYRALPQIREGYGGGVPLFSNCHYSFRNWHEYSGGKLTDWGAHHVDIACWALGATDTGPSLVTPVEYTLPVPYRDGHPTVADQYNAATEFTIRAAMPDDVEMIITSAGDNGILFEGTKGRFFVNRGKITGTPVDELKDRPLPDNAIEEVYGGPVAENHTANFVAAMRSRKQPISDVWSHNRMLEICHLSNIAMRLGRKISWDPAARRVIGDPQADSFLGRESRKGFAIDGA